MATHSTVLAWRIPGTEEPGGLLSMRWHRVGHDWSDLAAAAACLSGKESACQRRRDGLISGLGRSLEKKTATHSNVLAWKFPWTEEPARLQSMGSQRMGQDWATKHRNMSLIKEGVLLSKKIISCPTYILVCMFMFSKFLILPCFWGKKKCLFSLLLDHMTTKMVVIPLSRRKLLWTTNVSHICNLKILVASLKMWEAKGEISFNNMSYFKCSAPTPASNTQTPTGCLRIQPNSDTIYLKRASTFHRYRE